MDAGAVPRGGVYRARAPRKSALYRCVASHSGELIAAGGARRRVERDVLERFLDCGDPHEGSQGLRPRALRVLRPRLPPRVLMRALPGAPPAGALRASRFAPGEPVVQDPLLLPVVPPEARAAARRVDRGGGARAGPASPVRVHRAEGPARALPRRPRAARGALPAGRAAAAAVLPRREARGHARVRALRPDLRRSGDLEPATSPIVHALVADGVFQPGGSFQVLPALPKAALREALRRALLRLLVARRGWSAGATAGARSTTGSASVRRMQTAGATSRVT